MHVEQYVTQVQSQLGAAAALGDDRTRATADALATAAGPAIRLALLASATALADEVTAALLDAPGAPALWVRLDDDDLRVDVRASEPGEPHSHAAAANAEDSENTARISLRLPDPLKVQIETAARQEGVSVNTWIVRAVSAVLTGSRWGGKRAAGHNHRVTGWING
jgi:hypothetical protein